MARYVGGMLEAFAGGILANIVTLIFVYNLWKLTKNEKDIKAMLVILACCGVVLTVGFAVR